MSAPAGYFHKTKPRFMLLQRRHFAALGSRIVHQIIKQPDQAAILALLINPVTDQPDRARKNEESVQTIDREADINQDSGHSSIDVQDQIVLLHRRDRELLALDEREGLLSGQRVTGFVRTSSAQR